VPFCGRRCDYCAFATFTDRDHLMADYVEACLAELARAKTTGGLPPATSLYLGGGTPSRLDPALLARLVAAVDLAPGAEVTVECNPEDAGPDRLEALLAAGVTRLSLGIQSLRPRVLDALGRDLDPATARRALAAAGAAGFSSWNADLIFGSPAEEEADWRATLEEVLGLSRPPPHVSAYALTVERGTALSADPTRYPDPDVQAARYEVADALLSAAGYHWEEISSWALPGHECAHHALYWSQGDYLGIGSGAHSHRGGRRWWNVARPEAYIERVTHGASPVAGTETLAGADRAFERLALSLRTPAGVPAAALPDDDLPPGLVRRVGGRTVLTLWGRLVANDLSARLVTTGSVPG
jgi:oxygen-independent coproporphyrinogen-3 oxidase